MQHSDVSCSLDASLLNGLVHDGVLSDVTVLDTVGSTNAELRDTATHRDTPHMALLVAEHQTAGRGRLDRRWETPPRSAVTASLVVSPRGVPQGTWPWLTLLMGLSVAQVLRDSCGVDAALKWPNDVLIGGAEKICGVLAEVATDRNATPCVIVGFGVNVTQSAQDLPAGAVSLCTAGVTDPDRTRVLADIVTAFSRWYTRWSDARGDAQECGALDAVRARCATIGEEVHVTRSDGTVDVGVAVDVDPNGNLVYRSHDTGDNVSIAAGDVVHASMMRGAS